MHERHVSASGKVRAVAGCLLVIDMQEEYVGEGRNRRSHPYDALALIEAVNGRIADYPPEHVFYVLNRFFYESRKSPKTLVAGLDRVSGNVFEKRRGNAFTNPELALRLRAMDARSLELVGVDGNYCVAASALGGVREGFQTACNEHCIGTANKRKYERTRRKLAENSVRFI